MNKGISGNELTQAGMSKRFSLFWEAHRICKARKEKSARHFRKSGRDGIRQILDKQHVVALLVVDKFVDQLF